MARGPAAAAEPYLGISSLVFAGLAMCVAGILAASEEDPNDPLVHNKRTTDILPSLPILFKVLLPIAGRRPQPIFVAICLGALGLVALGCDTSAFALTIVNKDRENDCLKNYTGPIFLAPVSNELGGASLRG